MDMENKETREYLMSLIDEAGRVFSSDPLAESRRIVSYELKDPSSPARPVSISDDLSSCHDCSGYLSRTVMPRPMLKRGSRLMFILGVPDGQMMLEGSRIDSFRRWWKDSLLLSEGEWSLTSIIKCPVPAFSVECADACRAHLRSEMEEYRPGAIMVLGSAAVAYMLRRNEPIVGLMGRRYTINHIPAYVSPSLEEYAADPSLRRPIWENFLFVRRELGLEGRSAR